MLDAFSDDAVPVHLLTRQAFEVYFDRLRPGGLLLLEGGLVDSKMVLSGTANDASGKPARQRITWQKLSDGRVRQTWESSADGGATWTIAFDGYYSPRAFLHVPLL